MILVKDGGVDILSEGFYQTNNEVLKFNIDKDIDEIRFNQYICRKENLQRITGDLPRGQFYVTVRTISDDLNVSFAKAQRLLKEFMQLGIIEAVRVGAKDRTPSIYAYITSKNDTVSNTVSDTVKNSNITNLRGASDTVNDNVSDTSKKQNITNKYKNAISLLENGQVENKYIDILNHWNGEGVKKARSITVDIKKGIDSALKLIKEDGSRFTLDDLKKSISNYASLYKGDAFTYQWGLKEFVNKTQRDTGIRQVTLFSEEGSTYVNFKKVLKNKNPLTETSPVSRYKDFGSPY